MRLTLIDGEGGQRRRALNLNLLRVDAVMEALDQEGKPSGLTELAIGPDVYRVEEPVAYVAQEAEKAWSLVDAHPAPFDPMEAMAKLLGPVFGGPVKMPDGPGPVPTAAPAPWLSLPPQDPGAVVPCDDDTPPAGPLAGVPATMRCRNCQREAALARQCCHCGAHLVDLN